MHATLLSLLTLTLAAVTASPVDQKLASEDGPIRFRLDYGIGGPAPYDNLTAMRERFKAWVASNNAPHWIDDYDTICEAREYFDAGIYAFDLAKPHPSWDWTFEELATCFSGPYPGDFYESEMGHRLVRAKFAGLPKSVRHWAKEGDYSHGNKENLCHENNFCAVDGYAFFPPGWMLGHLPLFVDSAQCDGVFASTELYGQEGQDSRVSGSIIGKSEFGSSLRIRVFAGLHQRKTLWKDEL